MSRRFIAVCAVLFLIIQEFGFSEETVHIIKKGETIYSIARSYGVSAQAVLDLNRINDARTVQAGQRVRIPGAVPGQESAGVPLSAGSGTPGNSAGGFPGDSEYRVEKNDTLYSIARRYGTSTEALQELNGFSPSYVLKAGEKIRVPVMQAESRPAVGSGTASGAGTPAASGTAGGGKTPVPPAGAGKGPAKPEQPVRWPVSAREVSYIKGKLYGVQLTGERLEPVKSLTRGTVVSAGPYRGFGRVAIVQMPGGYLYVYGGCESLSVKEGDKVVPGTELGKLGVDVKSEKPQLFFFVYRSNNPIDPATAPRA